MVTTFTISTELRAMLQYFRNMDELLPKVTSCRVSSDDGQSRNIVLLGPTSCVVVTDVDSALVVVGILLVLEDTLPLIDATSSEVGVVVEGELSAD